MQAYRDALEGAGQVLEWTEERAKAARMLGQGRAYTFELLCQTCDADGDKLVSKCEWDNGEKGWEWLFSIIDTDKSGRIEQQEYDAFQEFKKQNPDWASLRTGNVRPE